MKWLIVMSMFLVVMAARPASAQVVIGGNAGIEFVPSNDHNTLDAGVPRLTRYELEIHVGTASGPISATVNLGKPTPVSGTIKIQPFTSFSPLIPGTYVAVARAIGPGGNSPDSAPTDPFVKPTPAPGAPGKPTVLP